MCGGRVSAQLRTCGGPRDKGGLADRWSSQTFRGRSRPPPSRAPHLWNERSPLLLIHVSDLVRSMSNQTADTELLFAFRPKRQALAA